jgi:hypothetical protein
MSSRTEGRKTRRRKRKKFIIICFFLFAIGYYLLNEVSTWFEVPLGNIFYVIVGCTLMAISGVYIGYSVKLLYFSKKKKKTRHFYLEDSSKDSESE